MDFRKLLQIFNSKLTNQVGLYRNYMNFFDLLTTIMEFAFNKPSGTYQVFPLHFT